MTNHIFATLCLMVWVTWIQGQTIQVCRPGYEKAGDRCYKLSTKQMTWARAVEYCEADGSQIVSLETTTEKELLASLVKHRQASFKWKFQNDYWGYFWLGGFRGRNAPDAAVHFWYRNSGKKERITIPMNTSPFTYPGYNLRYDCLVLQSGGGYTNAECHLEGIGLICEESVKEIRFPPQK